MFAKVDKKTLVQKLKKGGRAEKLHQEPTNTANCGVPDIEDADTFGAIRSQYFSPLQTRQQRKLRANSALKKEALHDKRIVESNVELEKSLPTVLVNKLKVIQKHKTKRVHPKKPQEQIATTSGASNEAPFLHWQPQHWQQVMQNIRVMRAAKEAPVDTMGCHRCADTDADEKTQRFHKLVALMLSSQTKDETTFAAMQRLKQYGLTPFSMANVELNKLEQLLYPVSFYKNKAKYIQQTSRILMERYASDIPRSIAELIALPGIGSKMAHICMATAWQEVTGIGVDVHVHRIANRLRWVQRATKEPERTRVSLEEWLPRELWSEVNHLLVGFGQTICTPVRPRCDSCLNSSICPAAMKNTVTNTTNIKEQNRQNKCSSNE